MRRVANRNSRSREHVGIVCSKCGSESHYWKRAMNASSVHRFKKTIVGYGFLLIDMGKDSSTSLLATGVTKRQKSFWKT